MKNKSFLGVLPATITLSKPHTILAIGILLKYHPKHIPIQKTFNKIVDTLDY